MAVWLIVWGNNTIGDLQKTADFLTSKAVDIPLDLSFLSQINFTNPQKEAVVLDTVFKPELWNVEIEKRGIRLAYDLPSSDSQNHTYPPWRFSVYFFNDIISFSGPFPHFASWYEICRDEHLKNGWLSVIRSIYRYLKAERIIAFTEWGFYGEDAESFKELETFLANHPERVADNLSTLEDPEKLYFETLTG